MRNARRVHRALEQFTGPLDAVAPDTLSKPGLLLKLGRAPVRIDLEALRLAAKRLREKTEK